MTTAAKPLSLGDSFVVWPPRLAGDDPFEGDHSADDWRRVAEMVDRYERQLVREAT